MALPDSLSTLVPYQALRWDLSISQRALRSGSELSEGPIMLSEGPIRLSGDRSLSGSRWPYQALRWPYQALRWPYHALRCQSTLSGYHNMALLIFGWVILSSWSHWELMPSRKPHINISEKWESEMSRKGLEPLTSVLPVQCSTRLAEYPIRLSDHGPIRLF
jgi:hypothetical protein